MNNQDLSASNSQKLIYIADDEENIRQLIKQFLIWISCKMFFQWTGTDGWFS